MGRRTTLDFSATNKGYLRRENVDLPKKGKARRRNLISSIAAENNAKMTIYVKARIDKTQLNSNCRF